MNGLPAPSRRQLAACVLVLIVLSTVLSWGSARTESLTLDEPVHLTAGASYLATGDFRLNPEHPPLAKIWAALPLIVVPHAPFSPGIPGFAEASTIEVARDWLGRKNDGESLGRAPRAAMLLLTTLFLAAIGLTIHRLFGPGPALVGLAAAALDPAILSHGHYVTTDVPLSLFLLLSILAFAAWIERPGMARFGLFAVALAASALTKFSWVLVLPVLGVMAAASILPARNARGSRPSLAAAFGALAGAVVIVVVAIWGAYGFRFSPFRSEIASPSLKPAPVIRAGLAPGQVGDAWRDVSRDWRGEPRTGIVDSLVRGMRDRKILPEAYLYGFAFARHWSDARKSYFRGRFSSEGFRAYFPVAFAVKTPLPSLVLAVAGLAALFLRKAPPIRSPILAVGVFGFATLYLFVAVLGNLNIGIRHLLPASPAFFALAGLAAAWAVSRAGRVAIALLAVLLLATALNAYPLYLGYFNQIAGGWQNGHLWLVDSNLDWNQDLLRLRDYQRAHPEERLVLLRYGNGPLPAGLSAEFFVAESDETTFAPLGSGTWVLSATMLVGTIQAIARQETWERSDVRERYRMLWGRFSALAQPPPETGSSEHDRLVFEGMRRGLLVMRLRSRTPDLRLGTGLFVYRLSDAEIADLTRPD